jgi:hypothetical protein
VPSIVHAEVEVLVPVVPPLLPPVAESPPVGDVPPLLGVPPVVVDPPVARVAPLSVAPPIADALSPRPSNAERPPQAANSAVEAATIAMGLSMTDDVRLFRNRVIISPHPGELHRPRPLLRRTNHPQKSLGGQFPARTVREQGR